LIVGLALFTSVLPFSFEVQPVGVQFTDITEQAHVTFKHVASPEKKYIVESMSGGVALFDYDNDGYQDIYASNGWITSKSTQDL